MTEKGKRSCKITLYILGAVCFILALISFFTPLDGAVKKTIWAVPPTGERIEISTEYDYFQTNFYDSLTESYNARIELHIILLVSIIINFFFTAALTGIELIKKNLSKSKILFLGLSVLPLFTFIISIVAQAESGGWVYDGSDFIYLKGYTDAGWNIYEETMINVSPNFIVSIIVSLFAFLSYVAASILNFIPAKRELSNQQVSESTLRICKNCGCLIAGSGNFCTKCGNEIVNDIPKYV